LLIAACVTACACSKAEPPSSAATVATPPAAAASSAGRGSIAGRTHTTGTAVVVLEPKTARTFSPPE